MSVNDWTPGHTYTKPTLVTVVYADGTTKRGIVSPITFNGAKLEFDDPTKQRSYVMPSGWQVSDIPGFVPCDSRKYIVTD